MGRLRLIGLILLGAAFAAGAAAFAAQNQGAPATARAAAISAPSLVTPGDGAAVDSVPPFSWSRVRRADEYEFQLSADARFRSTIASFTTRNTSATVDDTLFDGTYYWRVRAVSAAGTGSKWSATRSVRKRWPGEPALISPDADAHIVYPSTPVVLRWAPTPHAAKYEVAISSAPSLAGNIVTEAGKPLEVRGTSLAFPGTLSPGRYYWAVTPLDAGGLKGRRSEIRAFDWTWPSATATRIDDLWADPDTGSYADPQFQWDPIPGAARYEVEVNPSVDFAAGSKVCCSDPTTGTSLSPTQLLTNNTDMPGAEEGYHWRVRGIDLNGNAGQWNVGPTFRKTFDDVTPTIPALRVRDNLGNNLNGGATTSSPVIDWDPVPGAAGYEVHMVPWIAGGCNWGAAAVDSWGSPTPIATASTAWTPLAFTVTTPVPFTGIARETDKLASGGAYCVRVRARGGTDTTGKRVVSDWTTLGGFDKPAFVYSAPDTSGPSTQPVAADYKMPGGVEVLKGMPLFTWRDIPGACGYFIAVARDEDFTALVDVARTKIPAYAPRLRTYPDETTSYYWAVIPVTTVSGVCGPVFYGDPKANGPQTFEKRSAPPELLTPAPGAEPIDQPVFRWKGGFPNATGVEAARDYRLQISADPTFSNLIDDVKTASTAYTSSSTYPADTQVYWRVRATDELGVGLNWSDVGTFRRRLRIPEPSDGNPTRGQEFPVLRWKPVQGAVSYGLHIEESDGDKSDYEFSSTAASFKRMDALGQLRWQVRANFPKRTAGTVPGGYSPVQTFTRFVDPPPNAHLTSGSGRVLLDWDPVPEAFKYRVEFSATNGFSRLLDVKLTPNTNYAPRLIQKGFLDGGRLYWRVAPVDELNNVGGYATGTLGLPRGLRVLVSGSLVKRTRRTVSVMVTNAKNRAVPRARVKVSGAGVRARPRRTGKSGVARFGLRPGRRGSVTFTVTKAGYRGGTASTPVR